MPRIDAIDGMHLRETMLADRGEERLNSSFIYIFRI